MLVACALSWLQCHRVASGEPAAWLVVAGAAIVVKKGMRDGCFAASPVNSNLSLPRTGSAVRPLDHLYVRCELRGGTTGCGCGRSTFFVFTDQKTTKNERAPTAASLAGAPSERRPFTRPPGSAGARCRWSA